MTNCPGNNQRLGFYLQESNKLQQGQVDWGDFQYGTNCKLTIFADSNLNATLQINITYASADNFTIFLQPKIIDDNTSTHGIVENGYVHYKPGMYTLPRNWTMYVMYDTGKRSGHVKLSVRADEVEPVLDNSTVPAN